MTESKKPGRRGGHGGRRGSGRGGRSRGGNGPQRQREEEALGQALGPMPSRGYVDAETQKYFSELSTLIGAVTDAEERATLCSNALEEARGKELQLACHPSCSRVLEKLLVSSDVVHSISFLGQCSSIFATMAMDPSGSHVAEAALKSLAEALQESNAIENVLLKISQVLQENALNVMTSRYGSHVLRSFLFLLCGKPFDTDKKALPKRLGKANLEQYKQSKRPGFPKILKSFTNEILLQCKTSISELRLDMFAGPVFQTMLKALDGDRDDVTQAITVFLELDNEIKEGRVLESENVLKMIENRNGSHLMEVMLEVAPDVLYMKLLEEFFLNHLSRLAAHEFSNFVVQTLIASARQQGQVDLIFDALEKSFTELIKSRRAGVIASLMAACGRFNTRQREICRALAAAINSASGPTSDLVTRLLHLESYSSGSNRNETWKAEPDTKMSVLGCAMLQTIFTYSQQCCQRFLESFINLGATEILQAAKDRGGCHVVEAFLTSSASTKKKHSVIEKLKGRFAELAMHTGSHYIVGKCYDAANIKLKETITSELVPVERVLSKTKQGPYLLGKLNVVRYAKSPDTWKSIESTKQGTKEAFTKLFEGAEDGHLNNNDIPTKKETRNKTRKILDGEYGEVMMQLGFGPHKISAMLDHAEKHGSLAETNVKNESNKKKTNEDVASALDHAKKIGSVLERNVERDSVEEKDEIDVLFDAESKGQIKKKKKGKSKLLNTNLDGQLPVPLENISKRRKRRNSKQGDEENTKKRKGPQVVFS